MNGISHNEFLDLIYQNPGSAFEFNAHIPGAVISIYIGKDDSGREYYHRFERGNGGWWDKGVQ